MNQGLSTHGPAVDQPWWEGRAFAFAVVLLTALPLVWPDIPPLTDLPGHMGRYRIQLDLANSAELQRFYEFEWALIGNLGVDLLVQALAPIFGLERAVKLIVLTIPPLTATGYLWVAREAHGRVPPTTLFALPLTYNYPFLFGFVNFALSMALAFLAFALWLRLGRLGRWRLRAALFVPLGLTLWLVHVFGWATLGLLAFAAEAVRQREGGHSLVEAAFRGSLACAPLLPPILLMLAWRSGAVSGETGDWFAWRTKIGWLAMIFRDRWMPFDIISLAVPVTLLIVAFREQRLRYAWGLAAAALLLAAVFLMLPRILLGSAYADMRLAPYMLAVAILAMRLDANVTARIARLCAFAGLAFFLVRTAGTTASMAFYDRAYRLELIAVGHLPWGARMVAFVGQECRNQWQGKRLEHLPSLAIVRRHAFANDQWAMAGAQLVRVRHPEAGAYNADPSQIVVPKSCHGAPWLPIDQALAQLPEKAFDYVWLIQPPAYDLSLARGWQPVWRNGTSVLYRIPHRAPGAALDRGTSSGGDGAAMGKGTG